MIYTIHFEYLTDDWIDLFNFKTNLAYTSSTMVLTHFHSVTIV